MTLTRRSFLAGTSAIGLTLAAPAMATPPVRRFDAAILLEMARALAGRPFEPRPTVPQEWIDLSYEQYRSIWFRHDRALWLDTDRSYNVDFFHPGLYFPRAIQIFEVADGMATPVGFDLSAFDKTDKFPDLPLNDHMGFSGFRLRTELNQPGIKNEFCVFQGASYFRAIGIDQIYGLSARGLAVKTGDPMGEEFPEFTKFWLESPAPGQKTIIVHALMDSPSVAGAYRFEITPGTNCVMDVQATLFAREELGHIGLGALTSMFMFDETDPARFDDFRPAVHDNDGLMIHNGAGETLWRPLANPRNLQFSSFVDTNPRGFGLMQRAREFSDFADLEALYHKRPGVWVEPNGDWGEGSVVLVEIPTDREIYDNIVAYWRPRFSYQPGEQIDMAYRLTWCSQAPVEHAMPRVLNTRMGARHRGDRVVTIDFENSALYDEGPDAMSVHISSPHVETSAGVLQRNPETGGLRLAFAFDPGEREIVELRAQLRRDGEMASEVWLYRWTA